MEHEHAPFSRRAPGTTILGMARVFEDRETGSLWVVVTHEPEAGWSQEELAAAKAAFLGVKLYDYRQKNRPGS